MKKTILLLSIFAITAATTSSFAIHNEKDLSINTKVSSVDWVGKKVTGQHTGTVTIKEGTVHLHDGAFTKGKVVIDMTTLASSDMEGNMAKKLIGHLSSADFFDTKNHTTATLEITKVNKWYDAKGNELPNKKLIVGILTIKGISKPIEFPATVELKDGKLAAYAEMKIDRTLYDIKYGSGKFFEGLGDKMIDDEFIIKFKIAAE